MFATFALVHSNSKISHSYKSGSVGNSIFLQLRSNIFFVTCFIYGLWILTGILWYQYYNNWTMGTAFYYTMEAGLSIGFCDPSEKDDISKAFTIVFVLVGSSVVSGALGCFGHHFMKSKKRIVREKLTHLSQSWLDVEGNITALSLVRYFHFQVKYWIGWYSNRERTISFLVFLVWTGLGTGYAMAMEEYSFITALYWAVTSAATGGLQSPPCLKDTFGTTCDMGALRGGLMGVYFLVGVPGAFLSLSPLCCLLVCIFVMY